LYSPSESSSHGLVLIRFTIPEQIKPAAMESILGRMSRFPLEMELPLDILLSTPSQKEVEETVIPNSVPVLSSAKSL
jgi:hypothetical protein